MHESVLVADRGGIAGRIIATVRALGLKAIAVYSDADEHLPFVAAADEAILLGPAPPASSHLDVPRILEAASRTNARAVHPGSALSAEDARFAQAVLNAGLAWIGPSPQTLALLGERRGAGNRTAETAKDALRIDVQILGLADGTVVVLGERDHSARGPVAETPSPRVTPELRARLLDAAVHAGESVGYQGAGTVSFLVDTAARDFTIADVGPRLTPEHPITELVTGIDLVEQQLRVAAGEPPSFTAVEPRGHAIALLVQAEAPGEIKVWEEPVGDGIRIDTGYAEGTTVTSHYGPLLATLCVHAADRAAALERARAAVAAFRIEGVGTNLPFLAGAVVE